jgi:hypothetical protein
MAKIFSWLFAGGYEKDSRESKSQPRGKNTLAGGSSSNSSRQDLKLGLFLDVCALAK